MRDTLYVAIFAASAIISLAMTAYLYWRVRSTSVTANWFMISMLINAATAATNILALLTSNPAISRDWMAATNVLVVLVSTTTLFFTARLINKDHWFQGFYGPMLLALPAMVYLCLIPLGALQSNSSALIIGVDPGPVLGPFKNLFIAYFAGLPLLVIVLLIRYYRTLQEHVKRQEIALVIAGWIGVLGCSVFYQGFLSSVLHFPYFPLNIPLTALVSIVIVYALTRYGVSVFNPNDVAAHIIQAVPGVVIILDHSGTIIFANEATKDTLGHKPSQLIGGSVKHLFANKTGYEQFDQAVISFFRTNPTDHTAIEDTSLRSFAHTTIPVNINASCSRDNHGSVVNIILICTGIQQLKKAEIALIQEKQSVERKVKDRTRELSEAQAQLQTSIRSLPFGFTLVNTQNQVVFSNNLFGKLVHQPIPDERETSAKVLQKIDADFKDTISLLALIQQSQATLKPIEKNIMFGLNFFRFFFMPIIDTAGGTAKAIGTVITLEDTTEQKAAQRSRDEFFSIASHELRTPLTTIRGNSSMMLSFYGDTVKDPDFKVMVKDMHDSSVQLIGIVNDFLDVSRLEQGKVSFDFTAIELDGILEKVAYEMSQSINDKGITFNMDTYTLKSLPKIIGDEGRIKQVLYNLIGNAVKFTSQGGIFVTTGVGKDTVKITVRDTGRGISPENQHILFHKFQQATASLLTRDTMRGTGLGLYISKLLVEGMGGTIVLEKSVLGQGSSFTFTLLIASEKRLRGIKKLHQHVITNTATGLSDKAP